MICSSDVKTAVIARTIIFVKKKKKKNPQMQIMRQQGYRYHYAFSRKLLQRWLFTISQSQFLSQQLGKTPALRTLILFPNDVHFNYNYTTGLICALPHPLETRVWKENESS